MPRARDLGIGIGTLPTGPTNSVLDVEGVGLGHATVTRETAAPASPALVLAEDAYPRPLVAGGAVLNGLGDCTGFLTVRESGHARDARLADLDDAAGPRLRRGVRARAGPAPRGRRRRLHPGGGGVRRLVPQRLPTDVGDRRTTCRAAHAAALASRGSSAPPDEGSVGVGHGHVVPGLQGRHRHVVAGDARRAHGRGAADDELRRARAADRRRRPGRPAAGRLARRRSKPAGSCIGVVVTDAPGRPARLRAAGPADRAGAGPDRLGGPPRQRRDLPGREHDGPHGPGRSRSSTPVRGWRARQLDDLFAAVVDAAEESVLNSMLMSPTMVGRDGNTSRGARPRGRAAAGRGAPWPWTEQLRPHPDGRRRRAGGVPVPRRTTDEPQPCLLEALPYRKDDLTSSYAESYRPAARRVRLRRLPGRPARDRLVGRRRDRRVPARRADRPVHGDRLARRAGLVRRQRRHVRHVVLGLQLAPDRRRAAAGAEGGLRDLLQRRPVERRRALARATR